ncbi:conjugal transfer protein [Spiractinospora alimapuensis]|uniref:conjugal transfer protein n=1 Tax=Spiractinospora alimapuensis TaxID=2820884 RepID=UPI001F41CFA7|nr:conjugal transfer protein [Spiractinospora alimapuensis]QVQ51512.1 conjugal transfer protein [Spiractinospora alimapuensis]
MWVGRFVLWTFLLVVIALGILSLVRDGFARPSVGGDSAEETAEAAFPEAAAGSFAMGFAQVYLNADDEDRAEALAAFVAEEHIDALSADGAALSGSNIQLSGVDAENDQHGVVTLAAVVNGEPMGLDVPIYADHDGESLVVSGPPALLAAPQLADLEEAEEVETDNAARDEIQDDVESFFDAYAGESDLLDRFIAPDAQVTPLPEDLMTFQRLDDLTVISDPSGEPDVRAALATVVWGVAADEQDAPAELTQSYRIEVVQDGSNWVIQDLRGAPQTFGR